MYYITKQLSTRRGALSFAVAAGIMVAHACLGEETAIFAWQQTYRSLGRVEQVAFTECPMVLIVGVA